MVVIMENEIQFEESPKKKKRKILLIVLGSLVLAFVLLFFLWIRPAINKPISEPLSLPTMVTSSEEVEQAQLEPPSNLSEVPIFTRLTPAPDAKPVCGKDAEWIVLMVGIDYRGDDYLYGLADVIRVIRVDFVEMTVNMVALPRDLMVEAPDGRFTVPDPYKINQAYLFGTPGMGHYLGSGLGAGALAEVIQYNFGVPIDHYGVINFDTFVRFIDAIGGVDVDLPGPVAGPDGGFRAGPQTLNGEQALTLARIRQGYGDAFRVNNQTLIIRAVLNKLIKPAYWVQVPALLDEFGGAFLTDLSIEQLTSLGVCFLRNFESKNLRTFEAPSDLLTGGSAFIPSLNNTAFVYRWDEALIDWVHQSLVE
jgi:LCP family protein required for cell wall assembly